MSLADLLRSPHSGASAVLGLFCLRHIAHFTCLRVLMGYGLEAGGGDEDNSEILSNQTNTPL